MSEQAPIPDVCFIEDLVKHMRISRRQIGRLRRARVFPIRELPSLGNPKRFCGEDVRAYVAGKLRVDNVKAALSVVRRRKVG